MTFQIRSPEDNLLISNSVSSWRVHGTDVNNEIK